MAKQTALDMLKTEQAAMQAAITAEATNAAQIETAKVAYFKPFADAVNLLVDAGVSDDAGILPRCIGSSYSVSITKDLPISVSFNMSGPQDTPPFQFMVSRKARMIHNTDDLIAAFIDTIAPYVTVPVP